MNLEWEKEQLYLGYHYVAGYSYDAMRPKGTTERYIVQCLLPGVKRFVGYYETPAKAKEAAEEAVKDWLVRAKVTAFTALTQV